MYASQLPSLAAPAASRAARGLGHGLAGIELRMEFADEGACLAMWVARALARAH